MRKLIAYLEALRLMGFKMIVPNHLLDTVRLMGSGTNRVLEAEPEAGAVGGGRV
jgi:hypothetical protein